MGNAYNQASLFDEEGLDERFAEYHAQNPEVFQLFYSFARKAMAGGHKHYSADALFHLVRWHRTVETTDKQGFKINNNYISRYARLLAEIYPEFQGFFRNRVLRSK